jgi:CheY-like chemotaxis protein
MENEKKRDSSIVGQITGGVLHEFNNVLQGIIGLAEMVDADPSVPEKAKISMKAIRRLAQNATQIVQSLGDESKVPTMGTNDVAAVAATIVTEPPVDDKLSILVAEDDPLVLNVVTGMLRYLGYSTMSASDGQEALQTFIDNVDTIGMVITDMAMPIMGGLELAEKILADRPETKVVVMTGYIQEELNLDPEEFGLVGWLEKPMTADRLRQVVDPIMHNK